MSATDHDGKPPPRTARENFVSGLIGAVVVMLLAGLTGVIVIHRRNHPSVTIHLASPPATRLVPAPGQGVAASSAVCPSPRPAVVSSTGGLLEQVLVTPPDGFVQQPDAEVGGGVLTLHEAAENAVVAPEAAAKLQSYGFEGAVKRVWVDAGSLEQITQLLVEFSCDNGAVADFNRQVGGALDIARPQPFVVDGLPGAQGERSTVADSKGNYQQAIALVSGNIYSQTTTFTSLPDDGSLVGSIGNLQAGALSPL